MYQTDASHYLPRSPSTLALPHPYYRLAAWDACSRTWKDLGKAFPTSRKAGQAATAPGHYLILQVDVHRCQGLRTFEVMGGIQPHHLRLSSL